MKEKIKKYLGEFIEFTQSKLFIISLIVIGLVLALSSSSFASTSVLDEYPPLPTSPYTYNEFVIYNSLFNGEGDTYITIFGSNDSLENLTLHKINSMGMNIVCKIVDGTVTQTLGIKTFKLSSGGQWVSQDSFDYWTEHTADFQTTLTAQRYIFTTKDIYKDSSLSTVFFQGTPLLTYPPAVEEVPTLEETITQETTKAGEKIIQVMKTLTVFSIGLLALLIILVVLSKTLRVFRVK